MMMLNIIMKQGSCRLSVQRSPIQVIAWRCLSYNWMYTSNWSATDSYISVKSCCQHSASKARLPFLWCSGSLFQSGSSPLWSASGTGLGGWSWSSWSTCRWKYSCHGHHQSRKSLWKCLYVSTYEEGWSKNCYSIFSFHANSVYDRVSIYKCCRLGRLVWVCSM